MRSTDALEPWVERTISISTRLSLSSLPTPSQRLAPMENLRLLQWLSVACFLFLSGLASAAANNVTNNPADQLIEVLNQNRTKHHLSSLYDNVGLACIALQYIKAYQGSCKEVGGPSGEKPENSAFSESFAPACGVEISSLAQITGRLLGCQSDYVSPSQAFSDILVKNSKSLDILYNKNHTEFGAAVSGFGGGGPYFWCVLFSNGKKNSSFVLEDGSIKVSRPGCFSGANDECSYANRLNLGSFQLLSFALVAFVGAGYVFGV